VPEQASDLQARESSILTLAIHVRFPLSQQDFEPDDEIGALSGEIVALARIAGKPDLA